MKKNFSTFILITVLSIIIWLFGYYTKNFGWEIIIFKFLNSNIFIALVTLIAGLVAYHVYILQKKEIKANAAKLIIQEIRYAEEQIRSARILSQSKEETSYYMGYKILPTNSWHKNIHFFVEDLKEENQIDLISQFYSQAAYLDNIIKIISDEKNKTWQFVKTQFLAGGKGTLVRNGRILPSGCNTIDLCKEEHEQVEVKLQANQILSNVSNKIEFVYNSPAVDKLRSIADGKL